MSENPASENVARLLPVLEATDLDGMVDFLCRELDVRVDVVSPADAPAEVLLRGPVGGIVVRRSEVDGGGTLVVDDPRADVPERLLVAPNGARIEARGARRLEVPAGAASLSVVRASDATAEGAGRAGMTYRDLLPGRWGGRYVASHITIPDGGDVADWVHHHHIRFQMIFCAAGWVDVVYEDQGPPLRMMAGDCVLQPPGIRHRVLRSSPGVEVIEVGSPAVHDTIADHEMSLPTTTVAPERVFSGQRFVWHRAREVSAVPWLVPGWRTRDTGIAEASGSLASVSVLRPTSGDVEPVTLTHDGDIVLDVVLGGSAELVCSHGTEVRQALVGPRDAIAFPAGAEWSWRAPSSDLELLEVEVGAGAVRLA